MLHIKTNKQIEQEMLREFFDKIWAEKIKTAEELIQSGKYKTEGLIILCCYIGAISYERYIMSSPNITDGDAYKKILLNYSGIDLYQKIDLLFFYKWPRSEYSNHKSYKFFRKNNYDNYLKIKRLMEKKFVPPKNTKSLNRFIERKEILNMIDTAIISNINIDEIKNKLELFSVSEIFYRYYRCAGAHKGDVLIDLNIDLPIDTLTVLQTIRNILATLKNECVSTGKWPWEL